MLSFTINDTKLFMHLLLKSDSFDFFHFRQGEINAFATFIIEGKRNMDIYDTTQTEEGLSRYVSWQEMRPFVFHSIRGNTLPKRIKIILSLPDEKLPHLANTSAAFLNILFKDNVVFCTTAISQISFSLDKSSEKLWEEYVLKFFHKHNIGIQLQQE